MWNVLQSFLWEFWTILTEMSPYLLLGFLVAGVLSVLISPEVIERHLGGRGIIPVIKSSLFGVPLPLCSCGVIPVAASLRRHGASPGATTAFLLSTPQTGVDSIFVTYSLLGGVFAVFRPLAALISGLLGGWIVDLFVRSGPTQNGGAANVCPTCGEGDQKRGKIYHFYHYGFVDLPRDISKALLVGLLIAGIISAAVPNDYFSGSLGTGFGAKLLMMLVGIPIYVCATGSVPIAAALVSRGISPGAALVFLMTGPATNAATIATVWKTMGKLAAALYLGTIAVCSLAFGVLLDYINPISAQAGVEHVHPTMLPVVFNAACTVVLLLILGNALLRPVSKSPAAEAVESEVQTTLRIRGMTCTHCAQTVQRALSECAGVVAAQVDLRNGTAVIRGNNFDILSLRNAVEGVGYTVENHVRYHNSLQSKGK